MLSSEFHSDFAAWALSTHEISINGLLLTLPLRALALDALLKEAHDELFSWHALGDTHVKFAIKRENNQSFKIHALSQLKLSLPCARCLEFLSYDLNLDFSITMIESKESLPEYSFDSDSVEDSAGENEIAVAYFHGRIIDLGLIIREQIFLETPDYPHCNSPKAQGNATCKQAEALLSNAVSTRENPFVKFWKTN